MSEAYNLYLKTHIDTVYKCLRWMIDNLDLSCDEIIMIANLIILDDHDDSKYGEEYKPYDNYFYGKEQSDKIKESFDYAWLHHIHNNPHHWQHWVLINDDSRDGTYALEMPLKYVFEMVADWWSFSWRNDDLYEMFYWYAEHKNRIIFHPKTRECVENLLKKIELKLKEQEKNG